MLNVTLIILFIFLITNARLIQIGIGIQNTLEKSLKTLLLIPYFIIINPIWQQKKKKK